MIDPADYENMRDLIEARSIPEPNSGCWIWTGAFFANQGFARGKIQYRKRVYLAPRIAYQVFSGSIPKTAYVCHRCDTPMCVNPDHLWLGTPKQNQQDMAKKGRRRSPEMAGNKNPNRKLSQQDVDAIRSDVRSTTELMDIYGVSRSTMNSVRNGTTWTRAARQAHQDQREEGGR